MGKLTWKGWQTAEDIARDGVAQPTGPITKRDGTKVLTLTLREAMGKHGASDERQAAFAKMGDELIISPRARKRKR